MSYAFDDLVQAIRETRQVAAMANKDKGRLGAAMVGVETSLGCVLESLERLGDCGSEEMMRFAWGAVMDRMEAVKSELAEAKAASELWEENYNKAVEMRRAARKALRADDRLPPTPLPSGA